MARHAPTASQTRERGTLRPYDASNFSECLQGMEFRWMKPEDILIPGMIYEIATPYGNEAAAQILYEVLQAARREHPKSKESSDFPKPDDNTETI